MNWVPLLFLTSFLSFMMGILQAVLRVRAPCEELACETVGFMEAALAAIAWFAIALFFAVLGGVLAWMRWKASSLEI